MAKLVRVEMEHLSGLVEDRVVNTFALFGGNTATEADLQSIADEIADFYNEDTAGVGTAVGDFISEVISRGANAHQINIHRIETLDEFLGGPLGSPEHSSAWTLTQPPSGSPYPGEVAAVLTLEASGRAEAAVSDPQPPEGPAGDFRPKQRRTGRVYIGPLNSNTGALVDNRWRISTAFQQILRDSAVGLEAGLEAIALQDLELGVWSRADGKVRNLEAVSTDNAFDTQRRRGVEATVRTRTPIA